MPNITRPIASGAAAAANKTKILLVRQPVKSVRKQDERDPRPMRMAIGIVAAVGAVGAVWMLGYLGFRLGFAAIMGVPELLGEPGSGLATGALMLMTAPLRVFEVGIEQPMWLMVGFALIAIPGGALAGAKPITPGGPKPSNLFVTLSWTGAIGCALVAVGLVAYVSSPWRMGLLTPLASDLTDVRRWLNGLMIAAGLDGLALVASVMWLVLALRLSTPLWMRALSISLAALAVAVVALAMSISNAAVVHLRMERSAWIVRGGESDVVERVLVGYTRRHAVLMETDGGRVRFEMVDVPSTYRVAPGGSIAEALLAGIPVVEPQ